MSLASELQIADDIQEDGDRLGGDGYIWESAVYSTTIDLAYLTKGSSGAVGLNMVYKDVNGRELKNTFYIKSGDKKGNKTYYEKDGVKHNLPGMNNANAVALLTVGKNITDLVPEEKVVSLWDYTAGAEVNTKVEVYLDLLDQPIDIGVLRQIVDKNVEQPDGSWKPGGEVKDQNEVDKIFRSSDGLTVTEVKAGETEPVFKDKWAAKWTGVTQQKAKGAAAGGTTAGAPGTSGPTTTKKLFKSTP